MEKLMIISKIAVNNKFKHFVVALNEDPEREISFIENLIIPGHLMEISDSYKKAERFVRERYSLPTGKKRD